MAPRKRGKLSTSFRRNKIKPTKSGKQFKLSRKIRKKASQAVSDASFSMSYLTDSKVSTPVNRPRGKFKRRHTRAQTSHQMSLKKEEEASNESGKDCSFLLAGNVEDDVGSMSTSTISSDFSSLAHMFRNPHMSKSSHDQSGSQDSGPSVKSEVDVKEDFETIDITGYTDETQVESIGKEFLGMVKNDENDEDSDTIVLDDSQDDDDVIVVNDANFPALAPAAESKMKPLTPATLQNITSRYPSAAPDFIPISRGLVHQRAREPKRLNTNVRRLRSKGVKVVKPLASSELKPRYRSSNMPAASAASSSVIVSQGPTMLSAPSSNESQCLGTLRPIVIDGSNVAMSHGKDSTFSVKGIHLVVKYFQARGHTKIVAFVPQFRVQFGQSSDKHLLDELVKSGFVFLTPCRIVGNKRINSYDDTYVLDYAAQHGGIVVTRDNYRDLVDKKEEWREVVENRILMQTFVGDDLMFPHDPLGRHGPSLDTFLRF